MSSGLDEVREYIRSLREQGFPDRQIGRALREAGWTAQQVPYLLRGEAPPAARRSWVVVAGLPLIGVLVVIWAISFGPTLVPRRETPAVSQPPPASPAVPAVTIESPRAPVTLTIDRAEEWRSLPPSPPLPVPKVFTKENWATCFYVWGKEHYVITMPDGRRRGPRPAPPNSSSDQISASLDLEVPDEVWLGEKFTVRARGHYRLGPELERLVREGKATVQERYHWAINPAVNEDRKSRWQPVVTCWYQPGGEWITDRPQSGLYAVYIAGVFLPDGTVQWARAQDHREPVVRRLRVLVREPVQPLQKDSSGLPVAGIQDGKPHPVCRFVADAELLPGHQRPEGVQYEWDFNDGTRSTQNPIEHALRAPRTYYVTVRASWHGQVAVRAFPVQAGGLEEVADPHYNHRGEGTL